MPSTDLHSNRPRLVGPLLALVAVLAAPLRAGTVVEIPADRDNTLYESVEGDLSNGSGSSLFAGRTGQEIGAIRRALVRFDVAGSIPDGATILAAELRLEVTAEPPGAGPVLLELHAVDSSWGEGGSVALDPGGTGAAAESGDATWRHRFYPGTFWGNDGGDFAGAASSSISVDGFGQKIFPSTPQTVGDVQFWLDSPNSNRGWIVLGDESTPRTARRFDSREGGTPPLLVVEYEEGAPVPVLPTVALLALVVLLGAAGALALRERRPTA